MVKLKESIKIVWDGMTYDQLLTLWNTHHCAWAEDKLNERKIRTKQHWDNIVDFVEQQNNIEITIDDCIV